MITTAQLVPLTDRQHEIFVWLRSYMQKNCFSPSRRELCKQFNFSSVNGAVCHLVALRRKGWITWVDGLCRTIRLTEAAANVD